MKKKMRALAKGILVLIMTLSMILGTVPLTFVPGIMEVSAANVTSSFTTWTEDMTVSSTVTIESAVTVSGTVRLNLGTGATLTLSKGIVLDDASLTIDGSGTLIVNGENGADGNDSVGIAGGDAFSGSGNVTINWV